MSFVITAIAAASGDRLDVILKNAIPDHSRSQIQKAIRQGMCTVEGKPVLDPSLKLRSGQQITLELPQEETALAPSAKPLQILWRDEHMAVLAKPAGLTVHPCPSCQEETLAHRLVAHFPELANQEGQRPGIVHRLDRDTSGLMVIGLTAQARLNLARAFADRQIHKEYLALVAGEPENSGECHDSIGRHPSLKTRMAVIGASHGGRQAHTKWKRLWQGQQAALLAVRIMTGRTHQIRVHLAHHGMPILGDALYAPPAVAAMAPRQMLHAWRIELAHPVSGRLLHFCVPPPADFFDTALAASRFMRRIVVTGNAGCGKSSFCDWLAVNGIPVISADAIVARLYGGKSHATEWIASRLGEDCLTDSGSVNKAVLFEVLRARPDMRRELEKVIHGIVLAEIEDFWQKNAAAGAAAAAAEIPLYFESSFLSKINPRPYAVGISCPQKEREARLAASRGWDQAKISCMEEWQWPENRKMAACDHVIANDGSRDRLAEMAAVFAGEMRQRIQDEEEAVLRILTRLCACAQDLHPV